MEDAGCYAIITAFTPNFYDDFYLFYRSLRRYSRVPLMAFPVDYDEPPELPDDIYSINLTEAELKPFRNIGQRWVQWFKPSLIKRACKRHKLETVLWLDSDIVILDDVRPMFEKALETFFVMADNFAPHDCLNDDRLYEEYPSEVTEAEAKIALNSGVIGIRMPRDKKIIREWEERTKIVARNPHLMKYISLYDQGTLLWAMRDLKLLDKVIKKPEWNHNAKRNAYEDGVMAQRWPVPDIPRMGGDLFEEVKFDNPDAIIAHYAGLPKLTHLLHKDIQETQQFRWNKYRHAEPVRIFGVGLERAGTHSLAEILRRCCRVESWVRHEYTPTLSDQAVTKWLGKECDDDVLTERLELYKRWDIQLLSEVNHRLGFFIPEIKDAIPESKFVLLLRNPLDLIRSRLINFSGWSSELYKFPGFYQFDVYGMHKSFGAGSLDQNKHRLRPQAATWDLGPIEMHVWEVVETLRFVLKDLRNLPEDDYQIIWIEQLRESISDLSKLIPRHYLYWGEAVKWAGVRFGASVKCSDQSMRWIDDQIEQHAGFILSSIMDVLNEFDIKVFERCECV
jgi:hypothetical protein